MIALGILVYIQGAFLVVSKYTDGSVWSVFWDTSFMDS